MTAPCRTRTAAAAAAVSAALVLGMAGTAIAFEDLTCAGAPADGATCTPLQHRPGGTRLPGAPPGAPRADDPAIAADLESSAPVTTPQSAPDPDAAPSRDCRDFPYQAAAQAALQSHPDDRGRLDADGDGIACEQYFHTEGRQVAVVPVGGVATGGLPDS